MVAKAEQLSSYSNNEKSEKSANEKPQKPPKLNLFDDDSIAQILQTEKNQEPIKFFPDESEEKRAKLEKYYDGKIIAKRLERTNRKNIYLFKALHNEDGEWYRVGGTSALFYCYFLCPRLGRHAEFLDDHDLSYRFKAGVIAVHGLAPLNKKLEKLKYTIKEYPNYGLAVINLKHNFTKEEIENYATLQRDDAERVQKIIEPKENLPDLYSRLRELARNGGAMSKFARVKKEYRTTLGDRMINSIIDLFNLYFQIANGKLEKQTGGEKMLENINFLFAGLAICDEQRMFEIPIRAKIGTELSEVRAAVHRTLLKGEP